MTDPIILKLEDKPIPYNPDQNLHIDVQYLGKQDEYTCRLGLTLSKGRSLAEALHQLGNKLDALKIYGSDLFDVSEPSLGRRMTRCTYCGARMFFAKTVNDKWMPVDGSSVTGGMVTDVRRYILIDNCGQPQVKLAANPDGQVWIAHPEVCGARPAPTNPLLYERWTRNNQIVSKDMTEAVAGLKRAARDLEGMKNDDMD